LSGLKISNAAALVRRSAVLVNRICRRGADATAGDLSAIIVFERACSRRSLQI
jgi:hypothetical protein